MAAVGRGSRRRVDPTPLTVGAAVGRCPGLGVRLHVVQQRLALLLRDDAATPLLGCELHDGARPHHWAQWNVNTIAVIQATMSPIPGPG